MAALPCFNSFSFNVRSNENALVIISTIANYLAGKEIEETWFP